MTPPNKSADASTAAADAPDGSPAARAAAADAPDGSPAARAAAADLDRSPAACAAAADVLDGSPAARAGAVDAPDVRRVSRSRLVRGVWMSAGLILVAVGGIGVVVPGLPSTIFFILAAAAFSRSSTRLEQWLLRLPAVGKLIADHRAGLGMRRRAKLLANGMIVTAVGLSTGLAISTWSIRAIVLAAGAVGISYITWRVPTRERLAL